MGLAAINCFGENFDFMGLSQIRRCMFFFTVNNKTIRKNGFEFFFIPVFAGSSHARNVIGRVF